MSVNTSDDSKSESVSTARAWLDLVDGAAVLAIFTGLAYFNGWMYYDGYFDRLGIPRNSVDMASSAYFLAAFQSVFLLALSLTIFIVIAKPPRDGWRGFVDKSLGNALVLLLAILFAVAIGWG